MFKKIMLALDGSENAEKALPWVKRYAGPPAAQVLLFRAVPAGNLSKDGIARAEQEAREYLLRIEREINYAGIPCMIGTRTGKVAASIIHAAVLAGCELIIMTTRGGSPVKRWAVGGITEQVLRASPIPVLVVRSQMAIPRQGRVKRIIVPVDGSRLAESLLPWCRLLCRFFRASLVLVHVQPSAKTADTDAFRDLRRRMVDLASAMRQRGMPAQFRVLRGDPASEILGTAWRNDLIATTTHGAGGFKRWIFGSVAEKLIHESQTPIVVYKTPTQVRE